MEKNRDFSVAILINSKNEFLLQKKTIDYKPSPGIWCLFGGAIELKESPEQAIKREIKEEIGMEMNDLEFIEAIDYKLKEFKGKLYVFLILMNHEISEIRLQEGAGFAFFSKEELSSINISESSKKAIDNFIKKEKICFN